jgi:hypothetical protein
MFFFSGLTIVIFTFLVVFVVIQFYLIPSLILFMLVRVGFSTKHLLH